MLKTVQRSRLNVGLDMGKGRQLDRLPIRSGHIQVLQIVGGQSIDTFDLGNDFIATALDAEVIGVTASQQGCKVTTHLPQIQPHGRHFVPVEDNVGLGQIIFEIAIRKDKFTALERRSNQLLGELVDLQGLGG